jgi:hypothetical protein
MVIIRHAERGDGTFPKVRIDDRTLLPVDGGVEDVGFSEFRNELMAAIDRKDSQFLVSVLGPDIKIGFGSEPDNASEFEHAWKIGSPDSQVWTELDKVLKLGGRFEMGNDGKRAFCAPYLCGVWPDNVDPFSYVAIGATSAIDVTVSLIPEEHEEICERASIMEFDGGMPRAQADESALRDCGWMRRDSGRVN